jgi:ferrous iron transport protein B
MLISAPGPVAISIAPGLRQAVSNAREALEKAGEDRISSAINSRYARVHQIASESVKTRPAAEAQLTERLDDWLTHKVWGWVIFALVMGLMFFSVFRLAETPMEWIETGQKAFSTWVSARIPAGDFQDLIVNGIISGVGGVVIFLPQILILFLFIGLLEDTGYMARAAFIVDRLMSLAGLQGKSFVPMLSSFACAIPGIMAARGIDNAKDRLVTILVAPLMSCSARLPVYTLMIGVLLPDSFGAWQKAAIMLAMYFLGMLAAFSMAWLFRRTLFRGDRSFLLLEMPAYRWPSLKETLFRMWERAGLFLRRAGTIILGISVLIWALSTYPKPSNPKYPSGEQALVA